MIYLLMTLSSEMNMQTAMLSEASFDILLSLAGGPKHGYAMVQDIELRREGRTMQPGLLYTTLPKLLEVKLIEEVPAPLDNTDKRRRYYQLTTAGRMEVRAEAERRLSMAQKVSEIARGLTGSLA
jgi:DNA-binding PadR family transcriptional regulator